MPKSLGQLKLSKFTIDEKSERVEKEGNEINNDMQMVRRLLNRVADRDSSEDKISLMREIEDELIVLENQYGEIEKQETEIQTMSLKLLKEYTLLKDELDRIDRDVKSVKLESSNRQLEKAIGEVDKKKDEAEKFIAEQIEASRRHQNVMQALNRQMRVARLSGGKYDD